MAEKRNIFLVGPMGAGKSTIGRHLADELHLDFYDSDQEIEKRTGADIAWIFDLEGEDGFRKREEDIINDHVAFRTLGLDHLGIASFEKIFLHHGYEKKEFYSFFFHLPQE